MNLYLKNFLELILCCSDKMMCVSLFSYQGSLLFSSDSFNSLSCLKLFVKNFFHLFFCFSQAVVCSLKRQLLYFIISAIICQELFNFFRNRLAFKKRFALLRQLDYNITLIRACQPNFLLFFNFFYIFFSLSSAFLLRYCSLRSQ